MDDFSPEDKLAILRAELDQMLGLAPEVARAARGWFEAFQAQGFTDRQALYLTAVQLKESPGTAPA